MATRRVSCAYLAAAFRPRPAPRPPPASPSPSCLCRRLHPFPLLLPLRPFSTTPAAAAAPADPPATDKPRRRTKRELLEDAERPPREEDIVYEELQPHTVVAELTARMRPEEKKLLEDVHRHTHPEGETLATDVEAMAAELEAMVDAGDGTDKLFDRLADDDKPDKRSFWFDEDDPETVTESREDDQNDVDMPETAHIKLEEMREMRHLARIAAWEMPLLAQFGRPFEPPSDAHVLRFRYTTYMGDSHAAESKVVVQFSPDDVADLTEVQRQKLRKLAGPRYRPDKDLVHMSSEGFETQAQNKKYLSDLIDSMIEMAKDPADTFEDIPLDLRHHKTRPKPRFPIEWRMTDERREQLEQDRKIAAEAADARALLPLPIDGAARARELLAMSPDHVARERELLAGKVYTRLPQAIRKR